MGRRGFLALIVGGCALPTMALAVCEGDDPCEDEDEDADDKPTTTPGQADRGQADPGDDAWVGRRDGETWEAYDKRQKIQRERPGAMSDVLSGMSMP